MGISYKPLWVQLITKEIKKGQLSELTGISPSTISKMANNEYVALEVLERICVALDCQLSDIVVYVPKQNEKE
jgi:DNA-binding Xre family transcriptional regulator